MPHKVFIDGEAGTTGLQIRARLADRADLELISLPEALRKDRAARSEALNAADAVILCLPDEAARQAVALIDNPTTVVIDASTAHRTDHGWTYGFPEMGGSTRAELQRGRRIANPGCYATGFIALVRPLVDAGLLPAATPLSVNAVSGYTGGGKSMIAAFEDPAAPDHTDTPYRIYVTALGHKHLPEMRVHGRLDRPPVFAPAVGRYAQGMIVEIPLQLWALKGAPRLADLQSALTQAYAGEPFIRVASAEAARSTATLDPRACNGTNRMDLWAFGDEAAAQARLVAVLDNLGKGASGAAVQNLNLALGLEETEGL